VGVGVGVNAQPLTPTPTLTLTLTLTPTLTLTLAPARTCSTHKAKERRANLIELRKHPCVDVLHVSECDSDIEASPRFSCRTKRVAITLSARTAIRPAPLRHVQRDAAGSSAQLPSQVAVVHLNLRNDGPQRAQYFDDD
jgi:hypothetical protein